VTKWIIRVAEARVSGVFNATGAPHTLTIGQLMNAVRTVSGSDAALTWVEDAFLLEQGVQPFDGLPFWVPAEMVGIFKVSVERTLPPVSRIGQLLTPFEIP
jgi:2'-hydroxyisoflavone reductase